MNKEQQDLAWSCLPKEFKEEVKRMYRIADSDVYQMIATIVLENVFGIHNLTSDAEGEEMLTVSANTVRAYKENIDKYLLTAYSAYDKGFWIGQKGVFTDLFSSKCLPDENSSNLSRLEKNSEPKPSEPFKVGDKVRVVNDDVSGDHFFEGRVGQIIQVDARDSNEKYYFDFLGNRCWFKESDLESYTEPEKNPIPLKSGGLKSQDVDKHFDTILKDSFAKERRLNIATMAMQGILANPHPQMVEMDENKTAKLSLLMADALIKTIEKGGQQ